MTAENAGGETAFAGPVPLPPSSTLSTTPGAPLNDPAGHRHPAGSPPHRVIGVCVLCSDDATEWDHIWPRYWGGFDNPDNRQPLCRRCNASKGANVDVSLASSLQLSLALSSIGERVDRDMLRLGNAAVRRLGQMPIADVDRIYLLTGLCMAQSYVDTINELLGRKS